MTDDRTFTDAEARALWERAARLHAEAAARQLGPGSSEGDATPEADSDADGDYSTDVVVRSAVEAGIPAEYVEQALAEAKRDSGGGGKVDRWAEDYLNDRTATLSVSRILHAPIAQVYEAMQRIYPNLPFGLVLSGTDGRPPLQGGTLVFEIPYSISGLGGQPANKAIVDLRHWADVKELSVRLRAIPADPEAGTPDQTEVELWAPLAHTRRMNFWAGNSIGAAFGLVGGLIGGAIASSFVAGPLFPITTMAAVSLVTIGGSRKWWRPLYRMALRKGEGGMNRLIDALVVDLQTGGAFSRRVESGEQQSGDMVNKLMGDLGLQ